MQWQHKIMSAAQSLKCCSDWKGCLSILFSNEYIISYFVSLSSSPNLIRMLRNVCLSVLFLIIFLSFAKAQPFQVCSSPGQNSCTCGTAPKICTINDLDGYNFQMSTYQHPNDGPTPMCNPMPPGSGGTTSNNPTWVAFLAWCEEFTLELAFTNCTGGNTLA